MKGASLAAGCLIGAFCLQALLAVPRFSATGDEPIHIASGYSYWKTRDFRMEPDTPPTSKLIAALPLLLMHLKLDTSSTVWTNGAAAQSLFGFVFLYENDADRVLYWARIPVIALAALGALLTFLWARDLFGPAAGVTAACLYSFCPNLLAHGMLMTSDVPVSVFSVMTLYLFWKSSASSPPQTRRGGAKRRGGVGQQIDFVDQHHPYPSSAEEGNSKPSWRSDLAIGLALGAAMTTKFSAGILPIILAVLAIVRFGRPAIKSLAIMAIVCLVVIEASYFFAVSPWWYFHSVGGVNQYVIKDYPIYLFGQFKPGGYWYYFLAAFAVKATAPTLILIGLGMVRAMEGTINRWGETILLVSIGFIFVVTSAVAPQIGIRYLLPVFPLIFVWVSRITPDLLALRGGKIILAGLLGWHGISCLHAFPNYIPYMNELAGGASKGWELLDDSNIDWAQGLKQAAEYVRTRRLDRVTMYTFSPLDNPQYYGLPRNLQPSEVPEQLFGKRPRPGVYIISAHRVIRMRQVDPLWRTYEPVDRIGESLWVFSF